MIDPNVLEHSQQRQEDTTPAADAVSETFLSFMVKLLGAFTTVDPRVITREERRDGRTALGF